MKLKLKSKSIEIIKNHETRPMLIVMDLTGDYLNLKKMGLMVLN
jgi:hypothetical protein